MTRNSTNKQLALTRAAEAAAILQENENRMARRAFELRRQGKSFYQIAEIMELPEARVAGMVSGAIRAAANLVSTTEKRELMALEISRLDELQSAVWPLAVSGDTRAIDSTLKIIQMRAKMLGLEEQVQTNTVQAVIVQGGSTEYREALRMIAEGRGGEEDPES